MCVPSTCTSMTSSLRTHEEMLGFLGRDPGRQGQDAVFTRCFYGNLFPTYPKATVSMRLSAKPFNLIHLYTFDHTVKPLPCLGFGVSLFLEKVKKKNKREMEKKRSLFIKHLLCEVPSSLSLLEGSVMAEPPPSQECNQQ